MWWLSIHEFPGCILHSSTLCIILKKTYIYWDSYSQKNTKQSNKFQLLLNIDPIHNYKKRSFFQSGNMFPSSYIFSMTKIMQEWENVYNIVYTQNFSCISFIAQFNNTYTIKLQNLNNIHRRNNWMTNTSELTKPWLNILTMVIVHKNSKKRGRGSPSQRSPRFYSYK